MTSKEFKPGEIVTVRYANAGSSNTFIVESDCGETVLLQHPLFPQCLTRHSKDKLDLVAPNVKDSIERGLDFIRNNLKYLDYDTSVDHEALCLYFVVRRRMTPRQKNLLASICGTIAAFKLNNDLKAAMEMVKDNAAVLDEFNSMWYRNFAGLFSGKQPVTSKKQRSAIFNMAGFVMAELENPVVANGYN